MTGRLRIRLGSGAFLPFVVAVACGGSVGEASAIPGACEYYFTALMSHQSACGGGVVPFGLYVPVLSTANHDSFVALCGRILSTSNGAAANAVDTLDTCVSSLGSCGTATDCSGSLGTRPNGGTCMFDWQCASAKCAGGTSSLLPEPLCGVCASPLADGAECSFLQSACGGGLECPQTSGACTPLVGAGGSCGEYTYEDNCDPAQDLACDPTTLDCVSTPTLGQPCLSLCAASVCEAVNGQSNDTFACVPAKALGEACNPNAYLDECDPFLVCDDSATCVVWDPTICDVPH